MCTLSPGLVRLRDERAAQVSRNRLIVVGVALIVAAIIGTILFFEVRFASSISMKFNGSSIARKS